MRVPRAPPLPDLGCLCYCLLTMALPWLDNGSAVYCRVWGVGPSARPLKYCLVSRWPWCGWAWGTGAGGRNGQFQGPDRRPPLSPPWLPQPLFMLLADITHQSRHGPAHPRQPRSLDSEPQASIRRGREPGGGCPPKTPMRQQRNSLLLFSPTAATSHSPTERWGGLRRCSL